MNLREDGLMDKNSIENLNNPLVSVIMPAYNHEKYVESAVRSIWEMDYRPLELIALDDGSSDDTLSVLRRLEKTTPISMTVVAKKNEGICKTLNRGISLAKGKYITFLASDDEFVPERQSLHVQTLETEKCDNLAGCYGQQRIIDKNGEIIVDVVLRKMDYANKFVALLEGTCPRYLAGSTFRMDVVKELLFDPNLPHEDWDFFLRLAEKYELLYVPGVAFRYRKLGSGTNRNMDYVINTRMQVYEKFKDHPRVVEYGTKKFLSNIEARIAQNFFNIEQYGEARQWLLRSLTHHPAPAFRSWPLAVKLLLGKRTIRFMRHLKHSIT